MEIYLIRHTIPDISPGYCYGRSDLDMASSFSQEMRVIRDLIPCSLDRVYASPLKRCRKLADALFLDHSIAIEPGFQEIDWGLWEGRRWDDIPQSEWEPWTLDFVKVRPPQGESYEMFYQRVTQTWCRMIEKEQGLSVAVVTHAGVIRCILCYLFQVPLKDSFSVFKFGYGAVIKLNLDAENPSYFMKFAGISKI